MASPLINVYIPTYKPKPVHLREALDGLIAQTETGWTALVHDDASGANVRSIVEPYLTDGRVMFVESGTRRGIGGNWNACLRYGKAPFVQYLFQDDLWHPKYLEEAVKVMRAHPSAGFVSVEHAYKREGDIGGFERYEAIRQLRKEQIAPGFHDGKIFLRWWMERELFPNVVGEPSFVMLRRSIMQRAGPFLEDMAQGLDVEYWLRMLLNSDCFFIADELGGFRVHPSGTSALNEQAGKGLADRLRCLELLIGRLPAGPDRSAAIAARNRALDIMVGKYFSRVKTGKRTGGSGSDLKKYCLRHPLTIAGALARHFFRK